MQHGGSTDNYKNLFSEHSQRDTSTKAVVRDLKARVDKLEVIAEALWELLQENTNLSDTDMLEKVTQVDLKDGKYDHQKRKLIAKKCSRCGRMSNKRHTQCLYCGEVHLIGPFE
jgi:hypothetical protein